METTRELSVVPPQGMRCCYKTVWGGDHFAGYAQCLQGNHNGQRTVGKKG